MPEIRVNKLRACSECGRAKPPGQGRKLCNGCAELALTRRAIRRRHYCRGHYQRNREDRLAEGKARRDRDPDATRVANAASYRRQVASGQRHRYLLRRFGLSEAQFDALLQIQGGVCAICGGADKQRRLSVDHDHATGLVRGLLCSGCNGAKLGRLEDDTDRMSDRADELEEKAWRLRRAIEYLDDPPARRAIGQVVAP